MSTSRAARRSNRSRTRSERRTKDKLKNRPIQSTCNAVAQKLRPRMRCGLPLLSSCRLINTPHARVDGTSPTLCIIVSKFQESTEWSFIRRRPRPQGDSRSLFVPRTISCGQTASSLFPRHPGGLAFVGADARHDSGTKALPIRSCKRIAGVVDTNPGGRT